MKVVTAMVTGRLKVEINPTHPLSKEMLKRIKNKGEGHTYDSYQQSVRLLTDLGVVMFTGALMHAGYSEAQAWSAEVLGLEVETKKEKEDEEKKEKEEEEKK